MTPGGNDCGQITGKSGGHYWWDLGIGSFAAAKLFVDEGAYVFIMGRRQKELDEAVIAIGEQCNRRQGDVSGWLILIGSTKPSKAERRRIDVIFANAGFAEFAIGQHYRGTFRQAV